MNIDVNIPDGKSGDWEVSTFEVSEEDAVRYNIRAVFHVGARTIDPGKYKRLTRNGSVIMSTTPAEIADNREFFWEVEDRGGNILLNGLGLGVVLFKILKNKSVDSVTVIEISTDVIKLVAPSFAHDNRVNIIHADAFDWKPPKGVRYNAAWHDIWDNICATNLPEMIKLHRKYGRRCDWQGSWCKELCKRYL